ncbi:MAG: response regulator transcription factor [Bacteroidia bacterium]|nr:response regulator transcription factor [Bacteroidia bacterium]
MIKCIIVDDEVAAIENLQRIIQWYFEPDLQVLGFAHTLQDAVSLISSNPPDLLFLDVEMGQETGFMLLEKIRQTHPNLQVIFITAHMKYAIPALRKEAFDFLLKPVDPEDLKRAIERLKTKTAHPTHSPVAATLTLPMQNEVIVCRMDEISRCESEGNYTHVHLVKGGSLLVSKNLGSLEEKLIPNHFFRCHKSHLINLNELKSYVRTEGGYILMKDGSQIPLGRQYRAAFFELLGI